MANSHNPKLHAPSSDGVESSALDLDTYLLVESDDQLISTLQSALLSEREKTKDLIAQYNEIEELLKKANIKTGNLLEEHEKTKKLLDGKTDELQTITAKFNELNDKFSQLQKSSNEYTQCLNTHTENVLKQNKNLRTKLKKTRNKLSLSEKFVSLRLKQAKASYLNSLNRHVNTMVHQFRKLDQKTIQLEKLQQQRNLSQTSNQSLLQPSLTVKKLETRNKQKPQGKSHFRMFSNHKQQIRQLMQPTSRSARCGR